MKLVIARLVDEVIHYREVEGSSRGFDLLPVHRRLNGVRVHRFDGRPDIG